MASARQVARWIIDDLIRDLSDRRGLDNEWDAIDRDVKQEIVSLWMNIAEAYVKKYQPEN